MASHNVWNIGEVLGVMNRARMLGKINEEYVVARNRFISETRRMIKLGIAVPAPQGGSTGESWRILEKHHIYEADAVQVASAKHVDADTMYTGDKRLQKVARLESINSICLESTHSDRFKE